MIYERGRRMMLQKENEMLKNKLDRIKEVIDSEFEYKNEIRCHSSTVMKIKGILDEDKRK